MGLNKEQQMAVDSNAERILCLASAGAGKTSVLISRISRLVQDGVDPKSILALTFTNNAAAEMKGRYEMANPGKEVPEFRTFHAFCYSILCKDPNIRMALGYFSVPEIASEAQEKAIKENAKTQCNITLSKDKLTFRENLSRDEQFQVELYDKAVKRLMRSENLITFDMLNAEVAELFASGHPAAEPYKKKYKHIAVDECLSDDMWVLTDNGWYRIDRLYDAFTNKKPLPLVKSYNLETSEYEYKPIIGALKSDNREIFEVHTEGLNKIICTSNHKILTQRGYIEVKDLVVGRDMLILDSPSKQKTKYILNEDQYQICLGSYLGDGHLEKQSKFYTYRLQITQGIKQKEYFMSKINAFGISYHVGTSGYTGEVSILSSNPTPTFALSDDIFNCVLSDISPLGLAIWYQDDGTLDPSKSLRICTGSFSLEQVNKLVDMLNVRYAIKAIPFSDNKGYSYIRFNCKDRDKFLSIISPYMHPSMQYKTLLDISNNTNVYDVAYKNIGANFVDKITHIGIDTVYDLTIADNHNFITSKHAHRTASKTGTIVHNCQDTDSIQMKFLDSFSNSNFFVVGDTLQNLYSWRGTSNEFIKAMAKSPDWEKIRLFVNYRSTNQICQYSNEFSRTYADDSYWIEMQGTRDGDIVITKRVQGPAKYCAIDLKDIDDVLHERESLSGTSAILCRSNKEVNAVINYLKELGVDYNSGKDDKLQNLIDCALSDSFALNWLSAYLSEDKYGEYIRLSSQIQNPDVNWFLSNYGMHPQIQEDVQVIAALRNIANSADTVPNKLAQVSELLHLKLDLNPPTDIFGREFINYLKDNINVAKSSELYVGTIHSVKGLEYDNVFVMNVGSYSFRLVNEEMKNLFYVAITRAKNRLFVYKLFE